MTQGPFAVDVRPDWEGFVRCIRREGTPARVHVIELFLDPEVRWLVAERYGLLEGIDPQDPLWEARLHLRVQRLLGYDYVRCGLDDFYMPLNYDNTPDVADLPRSAGRNFVNLHRGPITTWNEFEAYPWPEVARASTRRFDWYADNLPDDMCVVASGGFAHFAEHLSWLMGYETLCYALFDQRDLVAAIARRLVELYRDSLELMLKYEQVKVVWGSDDMGFRTGTLISPDDLREFVLPGHKLMAEMSHAAGHPYILHACGNLAAILEDLIEDVKIDGKHSFEDTIEQVTDLKRTVGGRLSLLGGIDVDFLCRSSESAVRRRVRETLEVCQPGGGYCLGTGNSVANYIPFENYLAMLDEGRRFGAG